MRIVSLALENYFFNNIPVIETIQNNKDIFDFCLRLKTNKNSDPFFDYLENNEVKTMKVDKTTRYYISNSGGSLYTIGSNTSKRNGKKTGINVGYNSVIFNKYEEKDNYNINNNFYVAESKKIINLIEGAPLELFSN